MSSTTGAEAGALDGRRAVVSGASRGIGLECARALHDAGARVVLLARGADAIVQAAGEVGPRAAGVAADLGDTASIRETATAVRKVLGGTPDILVNNAGAFHLAAAERTSLADFERVVRVNLVGVFALVREFVGEMKARGSGHIVTLGSVADRYGFPENAAYAASKFGVRGLHEVLRAELRGSGVRVTLISPGPTDTSLWDPVDPDTRAGFTRRADMLDAAAVADAIAWAVTRPAATDIEEVRLARS